MQVYSNTWCVVINLAFHEQVGIGHFFPEMPQHLKVLELSPDYKEAIKVRLHSGHGCVVHLAPAWDMDHQ